MRSANSKSLAVRPPSEWVVIVTSTVSHEIERSGWWPISSAGADDRLHEVHRADEVVALERLADRVAGALPALEVREAAFDLRVVELWPYRQPYSSAGVMHAASRASSRRPPRRSSRSAWATTSSPSRTSATGRPRRSSCPRLTRSEIPDGLTPREIDAAVRELTAKGEAIYGLDSARARAPRARPDRDPGALRRLRRLLRRRVLDRGDAAGRPRRALARPGDPRRGAGRPGPAGRRVRRRRARRAPSPRAPRAPRRGSGARSRGRRGRASSRSSGSTHRSSAATGCPR